MKHRKKEEEKTNKKEKKRKKLYLFVFSERPCAVRQPSSTDHAPGRGEGRLRPLLHALPFNQVDDFFTYIYSLALSD